TTVPLWAPIFGDNKYSVVLKRWQSVGVLALLILCAGFAALAPAAVAQSTNKASSANSKKSKKRPAKAGASKRRRRSSPRLRRMHKAFVASSTLKAMARQLLQDRTPAAYRGVEAYARRHTKEDAGALAWLVLGYAHWLDHDQAKALGVNGRRTRADLLMKGRRFSDAAAAYRDLLNQVDSNDRPAIQLAMAEALRRSGDNKEAKKALESLPSSTPEINGQRLFNL